MIPLMAFVTLIAGFVLSGGRHLLVSYAGALAATVTLVIIAVQSIRALRALPESERVEWAWPTALGGCCVYGLLLVATLT
jgi:hypothetical protein